MPGCVQRAWFVLALGLALARALADPGDASMWQDVPRFDAAVEGARPWVRPDPARLFTLDAARLASILAHAGSEDRGSDPARVTLPLPDGRFAAFDALESPVLAPGLQARYPDCRAYVLRGVDALAPCGRLEWTSRGLTAMIRTRDGTALIDPYSAGDSTHYAAYWSRDLQVHGRPWSCLAETGDEVGLRGGVFSPRAGAFEFGPIRRTYRLALAATGEYTTLQGGVASTIAAMTTLVGRLNLIYESEASIRFVLVENNDLLIHTNPGADPYTNSNLTTMLAENQASIDAKIGSGAYDVGHVLSTTTGGLASIGVACVEGVKARGVTGSPLPPTDAYTVQTFAHEVGHQFGARHTYNGVDGSCTAGQRSPLDAYEPGSGSTLMSYAGYCATDNVIATVGDLYFHESSLDRLYEHVTTLGTCAQETSTGNHAPSINPIPAATIPTNTPFGIECSGIDEDGDTIRWCVEQHDLGPQAALSAGDNGLGPIVRSREPSENPRRSFPREAELLGNTLLPAEILPTTTRTLTFRVTARDFRAGGGGARSAPATITVTNTAGPFRVTSPNMSVSWNAGPHVVTWDVANTNQAPVSVSSVRILLSTDGGATWPTVLAGSTPNSGSAAVTIPPIATSQARVRVEGVGSLFFDVSDADFTITCDPPANVSATDDLCDKVRVTWDPAVGATSYSVWRGTSATPGGETLIGSTSALFFDDSGIAQGTTRYYFVRAASSACTSNLSVPDAGTRVGLGAVQGVSATRGTYCDRVDVAWDAFPSATFYQLRRSTSSNINDSVLIATPTTNAHSDFTAQPGATYHYFVRASTPCGFSGFSTPASGYRLGSAGVPGSLQSVGQCAGVSLTWAAAANAIGYEVWRGPDANLANAALVGTPTSPAYLDPAAPAGVTTRYWVRATNGCAFGAYAGPAAAQPLDPPSIQQQPAPALLCPGSDAVFTITVVGSAPLIYHWTRDNVPVGTNAPTLTIAGVTFADSGTVVRCTVTNACGSVNSDPAALTLHVCGPAIYVDAAAPAGGNGTSWGEALRSLADALAIAAAEPSVDEVRVAAGTYLPGTQRDDAFAIPAGVTVKGGYPPGGGDEASRDPAIHRTVLSGDLLGDDEPAFTNRADNALHVVDAPAAGAVIDGCTISGGNADGPLDDARGGGVLVRAGASLTLRDARVESNQASTSGGGIHAAGTLVLDRSLVAFNQATSGGGVSIASLATITSSTISSNVATLAAGGGLLVAGEAQASVAHATIAFNLAPDLGGGIRVASGVLHLRASIIADNLAPDASDVAGDLGSLGHNIVRAAPGVLGSVPSDRIGRNPRLLPLTDNGGPTPTHLVARTSIAVDAFDAPCDAPVDQRGVARPAPAILGGDPACDVGAVELLPDLPVCPADLDDGSGVGLSDNGVDIADLLYFLNQFELGALPADLDDGSGTGAPDDGVDTSDLIYFLQRFEQGC